MNTPPRSLRDHLRAASDALSRVAADVPATRSEQSVAGISEAQLKQIVLQNVRKHVSAAATAALRAPELAVLPGLGRQVDPAEVGLRSSLVDAWNGLAELAALGGDKQAAVAHYSRTLEIEPSNALAHAQLSELFEGRHELEPARVHAQAALRADPKNLVAGIALARVLMREKNFAEAERTALAVTNAPRIIDEQALAWAIVGEARDRQGNTAGAFSAFKQANDLMLQQYRSVQELQHPAHPRSVRGLTEFVLRTDFPARRGSATFNSPAPVFLVGFPRSGTTLLEQILASHSKITCIEEKEYFVQALSVVLKDGDALERVMALPPADVEAVREAYWRIVPVERPINGDVVVDKHPLHITELPLIYKFFPDAKIILALRDPRDVVLSCYQASFGMNVASAQFLELKRAAEYYDAVMELLVACREKLQLDLLEVRYHYIVADLQNEARSLADFVGVPFEQAMLKYDQTARARTITTASARQVINPIYDRSVDRWRRYDRELAPVLPILNAWARRLGYDA